MRIRMLGAAMLAIAVTACTKGWMSTPEAEVAVLSAGPQSVVVGPVGSATDARGRSLADAHCRQYGLAAHLPRMIDVDKAHFICIQ